MSKRPNFLIILADDLGYSDIGCYGSEIDTPNLDALANEGLRLTNYHTAAACSPTRSMIMSGTDNHLAGVGTMIEYKQNEAGAKRYSGKAGYDGYMNKSVATIAEILSDNGYFTAHGGKWHLGLRPDHGPHARGFQKTFAVLPGCCNHFGWEPVLETGYAGMPIGGRPLHSDNGKRFIVPPNKTEDPEGFYSSDYYTDKLLGYLKDRQGEEKEKPFFGYLAFSAPHWPLQSRRESREKYWNKYNDGPIELRKRRLARLVELGLVDKDVVPHDMVAPEVPEWDTFTPEEKLASTRAMAAYAGMVDEIDQNVGKVVEYLKASGEYDNTMILFMSDNGAEGAALEAAPVMGQKIKEAIHEFYNNSPDNLGAWNSYCWLGPLWAQASTAPSRLYKCYPSEGGILVPCVVKAPKNLYQPKWQNGAISHTFTTCMDLAATFLDLIDVRLPPAPTPKKVIFRGREVHQMRGKSWKPFFIEGKGRVEEFGVYGEDETIGWELFARGALRKGHWKITHLPKSHGGKGDTFADNDDGWELYNVLEDPGETKDLGSTHPEKLQELLTHWREYVVDFGIVWGDYAKAAGKPREEVPMLWDNGFEQQRTWMQTPVGETPTFA